MALVSAGVTRKKMHAGGLAEVAARTAARVENGLLAVGLRLYDLSQEVVPRDTEALALSARVRQEGSGFGTVVVVGYGVDGFEVTEYSPREGRTVTRVPAEYAVIVHEGWGPGVVYSGQSHFLVTPLYTRQDELRAVFNAHL